MDGDDGVVKILIEFGLNDSQARQAVDRIKEVQNATKDSNSATQDSVPAMNEAAGASESLGKMHRSLHLALRAISQESPIAGAALYTSMLGSIGAIFAVVELFSMAREKLKEYNEELDETGKLASQPLDGGVKSLQDAWDRAAENVGKYIAASKASSAGDSDAFKTEADNAKNLEDARLEGISKIITALGLQAEAQIRLNDASDPEKLKAELESSQAKTRSLLEEVQATKESGDLKRLLAEQTERQALQSSGVLDFARNAADNAARLSDQKFNNDKATLENARKAVLPDSPESKAVEKAAATSAAANALAEKYKGTDAQPVFDKSAKDAQDALSKATTTLNSYQKLVKDLTANESQRIAEHETVLKAQEQADKIALQNSERLKQLVGEIASASGLLSVQRSSESFKSVIDSGLINQAADIYDHLSKGEKLNQSQVNVIVALRGMLDQAHENSEAILGLILQGEKKHQTLAQIIASIQDQVVSGGFKRPQ